ncbi:hypothetical protein HY383_03405 [Candidatus Daviesbacteria bacterium]|nr:hypothetical protein [Candidatus Daviesbacteria bacterium]
MIKNLSNSKLTWFIVIFYLILLAWWVKILISGQKEGFENNLFGAVYPILALVGGANGLIISRIYGGWSSVMGRGIIYLSLALLGQVFGQFIWAYFNLIAKVEVPYPSIADIGYISVIPFNILAMWSFAKASGIKLSLSKMGGKIQAVLIPLILLVVAYALLLKDYEIDFADPIRVFLDFAYPTGEAFYISLAILTYLLSRKLLGGIMRPKILFFILAFTIQFLTDYTFLYSVSREFYYNAGIVDLMYTTSFAIYSLALVNLKFLNTD